MEKNTPSNIINPQSLRVLIVEDSEDDALLVLRALKKGGYDPLSERVETAAAMKKALQEKQWDIILCDYKMPKFSGAQAIALLKETNIDIPLIIVSGTIGEETAIECMRSGTHDYIMKNNLSRLCPAIARELEETKVRKKQQQADEALKKSEENFRLSIDDSPLGVRIVNTEGETIYANQAVLDIYGYDSMEEINRIPIKERYTPQSYADYKIRKEKRERGELGPPEYEISIVRKNGEVRYLRAFHKEILWNSVKKAQIIYQDITERKRVEDNLRQSEEKYRSILENIEDGYYEVDIKGNFTFFNDSMCRILGYPQEEMMSMNNRQFTDKENAKKLFKTFNEVYRTGVTAKALDWQIIRKDETKRFIEVSVSLQKDSSGKPIGFQGIARDVTERKQAEGSQREIEERYRKLVENASDIVFRTDDTGHFTFVNPAVLRVTGYGKEEIIGKHYRKLIHPDMLDEVMKLFVSQLENLVQNAYYEFRTRTKDGQEIWIGQNTQLIVEDGHVVGFQAVARDITERKRAVEDLKESEKKYRLLADNVDDVIFVLDMNLNHTYVSPSVKTLIGYEPEEFLKLRVSETMTPSSWDLTTKKLSKEIEKYEHGEITKLQILQLEMKRKDGSTIWTEVKASFARDENQRPIGIIGVCREITERKKMEETLRKSEERYRTILDEMADAYFEVDVAGNYTFLNDACCHHLGYSREELIGTSFRDQMVKEELEKVYKAFGKIYMTGKPERNIFYKMIRKDGTIGFAEMTGFPLKNQQEEVIGFRGVGQDVTERKRAEDALRESEALYHLLAEHMTDIVWIMNMDLNVTWVSPSAMKARGFSWDEIAALPLDRQLTPESLRKAVNWLGKLMRLEKDGRISETDGILSRELEFYCKDGRTIVLDCIFQFIRDEQGKATGILAEGRDITARKRVEEELKQSFDRLRKALGATVQSISTIVEMKDPYTAGHQQRVSDLARSIAAEMGLSADRRDFIRTASAIHDIGKISIPAEILSKPTKLTNLEFNLIKTHAQSGHDILKDIEFPWPVADVVLQHHERMDGSGYPQGLKGNDIFLEARIMAVADVVEAIASHRPYRPALGIDFALEEISRNKGILYDADAVDACLKLFREKDYTMVFKKS
jgi:PAS domain S-box-containing protein